MVKKAKSPLGLYIHIPFCSARCGYCDFVTFTGKEDQRDAYVKALVSEIQLYAAGGSLPAIRTVFFGGGTPSLLEPSHIHGIFAALHKQLPLAPDVEVTLEANPESVTPEKLASWRDAGINRLSMGLQAYDDRLLKAMGRIHTVRQFEDAFRNARQAGFSNLNIDLIYGFPDQSLDDWKTTLLSTIALEPDHISLYSLTVEEHTPFGAAGIRVDTDIQADMYGVARDYLPTRGFNQYEVSNFSRPGKMCRHNLIYWLGQDYLGLGVGAVGCVAGVRWDNHKNLLSYYKDLRAGQLPRLRAETLDVQTQKFERLMLGLRLREGFFWGEELDPVWLAERSKLASQGYLEEIQPGTWRIPDNFVPVTNQILLPFLTPSK